MTGDGRIFVALTGCGDCDLVGAVRMALEQAHRPDRLHFGLVEIAHQSRRADLLALGGNIAALHVAPEDSQGPVWARGMAMDLRDEEAFVLQVAPGRTFAADWDRSLLRLWHGIADAEGHRRVLISEPPPTGMGAGADMRGYLVSSEFRFAPMAFADTFPVDRALDDAAECLALSARLYTSGWRIAYPADPGLGRDPAANVKGVQSPSALTHAPTGAQSSASARARLDRILAGEVTGAYGIGTARQVEDFLRAAGFSRPAE